MRRIDEGQLIGRFVEGADRSQSVSFPERLDDYIGEDNPVRVKAGLSRDRRDASRREGSAGPAAGPERGREVLAAG